MSLMDVVEAGDVTGVIRELDGLTPLRRKEFGAALATRRAALELEYVYGQPTNLLDAQVAAELGCQDSASAAADYLRDLERQRGLTSMTEDGTWLVAVLELRPVEWRVELVGFLSEYEPTWRTFGFWLLEHLVHDTGCPLPTTDGFLTAWLHDRWVGSRLRTTDFKGRVSGEDMRERLLADPWTDQLLPLALTRPGVDLPLQVLAEVSAVEPGLLDRVQLARRCFALFPDVEVWLWNLLTSVDLTPAEDARIAAVRVELLDQGVERLLKDGTRPELSYELQLLRAMSPTPAEHAVLARDYLTLLDGSPPVVEYAQEVLAVLDETGSVEPELLTEAGERVLLRSEKKLVRAQLSWLDKTAKRDPARAVQVVRSAAIAFDNQESALRDRALAVVARHLKAAGDSVLPELRTAAERLGPGLSRQAAELFGLPTAGTVERFVDILPAVPVPRSVPGPIGTAEEVAEEVAAVLAGDQDVVAFERALDGLVRHAHLDRAALAVALEPVTRKEPRWHHDHRPVELYDVARAVRDEPPRKLDFLTVRSETLAGDVLLARMIEVADAVRSGPPPFLLAVPTRATGALDAPVLVERLAAYEELDITPGPVDLAQALLRVTPTTDDAVIAAAGELGSDAGKRLAHWLTTGGMPHQDSKPEDWDPRTAHQRNAFLKRSCPGFVVDPPLPEAVAALIKPYTEEDQDEQPPQPFWIAQLPHHRDMIAVRQYFMTSAKGRGAPTLPLLAESGGPAGYSVHMALAWSAGTHRPQDREPWADAILVLAARGQLDTALLGQLLAVLARTGLVQLDKLVEALRVVVDMGAPALVWSALEAALPLVLCDKPVRGCEALLAFAVDCASKCGANGEITAVTAVAEKGGSSQTAKNARALREVLRRARR